MVAVGAVGIAEDVAVDIQLDRYSLFDGKGLVAETGHCNVIGIADITAVVEACIVAVKTMQIVADIVVGVGIRN